jgi:hypothetical protein
MHGVKEKTKKAFPPVIEDSVRVRPDRSGWASVGGGLDQGLEGSHGFEEKTRFTWHIL